MNKMETREYNISFTTPAFLGNADQQAQWRTPPFKALLRQWWRVAVAKQVGYEVKELRKAENNLFGAARDQATSQSLLRLRLSKWDSGRLEKWPGGGGKIKHPEVGSPVSTELYLGYGPLANDRGGAKLGNIRDTAGMAHTAIQEKVDSSILSLRFPVQYQDEIDQAMQLAAWFGAIGSRARNGWGSLEATNTNNLHVLKIENLQPYLSLLEQSLKKDWPHAIGQDANGPLVWKTPVYDTWRDAITALAKIKIAFRTGPDLFSFAGKKNGDFSERQVLAYPVTKHSYNRWGGNKRLANQVRFKVIREKGQYIGLIFHLPCALPSEFANSLPHDASSELSIWQQVHAELDNALPNGRLK